jgi:large subunit ribosomal protein L22
MEAKAVAKYIRVSPRKTRQVADLIRGKRVREALGILRFIPKRSGRPMEKVLKSAIANAEHNYNMDVEDLFVDSVFVDQGPTLKRYQPRAMGRVNLRKHRTSHITVVVGDRRGI